MIRNFFKQLKNFREARENINLSRQLVGEDRFGNKYY